MASIIPQMSLFLGIIPALILLWIGLKGYEGYYKDKTIFLTFIIGIAIGFASAIIEVFTIAVGIFYIVLFPFLEQMFKTIVLNAQRLQEKRETVIYGLSLGLGFGSIFTPANLLLLNLQNQDLLFVVLVVVGSFGIILFHAATGVFIGYGVYSGKLLKWAMLSIAAQIPLTATVFLTQYYQMGYLQVLLVAYGAVFYWYALRYVLPRIHADYQRRKRAKAEPIKA